MNFLFVRILNAEDKIVWDMATGSLLPIALSSHKTEIS